MEKQKIPRSCGTHDGTFHADEVTACALLWLFDMIEPDLIVRTRQPELLSRCEYVCDVGGIYDSDLKLFDHHQADYSGPLSSAGMVLLYLKEIGKLTESEYHAFNSAIIQGVDAHDNGKDPQIPGLCTYSHIVSNFTPINHDVDAESLNNAFHEALHFAKDHLKRFWRRYQYIHSCRDVVVNVMRQSDRFLLFEKSIPWMDCFFEFGGVNHPAEYVIMPSGKHWKLRGIPPTPEDKMKVRRPLPLEWAGLLDADLKVVTGIGGSIFCHKGRFISVWETREDALKALNLIYGMEAKVS